MLRRLTVLLLLIMPLAAHADDASTLGQQTQASSSLQQADTSSGTTAASGSALQPASAGTPSLPASNGTGTSTNNSGTSSLEAMDSSGLGGSTTASQSLQQTDASTVAKLLVQGEADQPHQLSGRGTTVTWLGYAALILLVASAITAVLWWLQHRRF